MPTTSKLDLFPFSTPHMPGIFFGFEVDYGYALPREELARFVACHMRTPASATSPVLLPFEGDEVTYYLVAGGGPHIRQADPDLSRCMGQPMWILDRSMDLDLERLDLLDFDPEYGTDPEGLTTAQADALVALDLEGLLLGPVALAQGAAVVASRTREGGDIVGLRIARNGEITEMRGVPADVCDNCGEERATMRCADHRRYCVRCRRANESARPEFRPA